MPDVTLCAALRDKIDEQIERTCHLMGLLPGPPAGAPAVELDWTPPTWTAGPAGWTVGELLGHLLECMAGFCAVLAAAEPQRLAHFSKLRELRVNHRCSPAEAAAQLAIYEAHIKEGFALLTDADLARRIPTVFVAEGETVITLLLGNLEHMINHKHQLFTYLKQMGVPVATPDLYHFRG